LISQLAKAENRHWSLVIGPWSLPKTHRKTTTTVE
jgi:hypothetical protein